MRTIDVLAAAAIVLPLSISFAVPASAASYTNALNACYAQIESEAEGIRSHRMQKVKSRAGGRVQLWIDSRMQDRTYVRSFCTATTSGELIALESAPGRWAGNYSAAPYSNVAAR